MKSLYSVLEAHFSRNDYVKHNYLNDVITSLIEKQSIRIGKNGENTIVIEPNIAKSLKNEFEKLGKNIGIDQFNDIMSRYNLPVWTKLFKGDFSGYSGGLASGNKGYQFEYDFIDNFSEYAKKLTECINETDDLVNYEDILCSEIKHVGGRNAKRPINITSNNITVGNIKSSGDDLADVLITTIGDKSSDSKSYNISLKTTDRVSFINVGVKQLFPVNSFKKFEENANYHPGKQGEALLDFFGIDYNEFAKIFTQYKPGKNIKKSPKTEVDVTENAKSNKFMNFVKSVIGYNYILVHKTVKHGVEYYNLLTENQLNDFIGSIESMTVLYPSIGDAKRIDIKLETSNLTITFNIRSKDGGIYPTHLMADYHIK